MVGEAHIGTDEAAAYLGVTPCQLRRLKVQEGLPYYAVRANHHVYLRSELELWRQGRMRARTPRRVNIYVHDSGAERHALAQALLDGVRRPSVIPSARSVDPPGSLGELVHRRRAEMGVGRGRLASAAGVARGTIKHLERGTTSPRAHTVARVLLALDVSPEQATATLGASRCADRVLHWMDKLHSDGLVMPVTPVRPITPTTSAGQDEQDGGGSTLVLHVPVGAVVRVSMA